MNKNEYYRCFSQNQLNWLLGLDKGYEYILKAKDCKSLNDFWLFKRSKELDEDLKDWSNNNPYFSKIKVKL